MPVYKFSMLFNFTSAISTPTAPLHRTAGWSESWYFTDTSVAGVLGYFTGSDGRSVRPGLVPKRATLLPLGTAITGYRIQQVSPPGPSQSGAFNYPGIQGNLADVPANALLCKSPGVGVNNIRRFFLRGIPDAFIVEGEFNPSYAYSVDLTGFFLNLFGIQFRGRDLSQPTFRIVSIVTTGGITTVTTETPPTFVSGAMVRILRSLDTGRNLRGGRFQCSGSSIGNTFQIANWGFGNTTGGSARLDAIVYPTVDSVNSNFQRILVRRVGRPFGGYRGRRSKRR